MYIHVCTLYRVFNKYETSKFVVGVIHDDKRKFETIILW